MSKLNLSRRSMLAGTVASASVLAMPAYLKSADRSLKVGVYGGYFKDSFDKHIFPEFALATGISVTSVAEPTGEAWVVQLEQAARAGKAPADVNLIGHTSMQRGKKTRLFTPIDFSRIQHRNDLLQQYLQRYDNGEISGIGAVAWYITLVSNTDVFPEAPASWATMWEPDKKSQLGLLALVSNSYLLEVTASTFFGGTDYLSGEAEILEVMHKLAELKDNVQLWYRDEAQFEQALKSGEVPMGQYYHDVTGLAAADGFPVRSTFPKEGGILDGGSWALLRTSDKYEEAHVFIDYMSSPEIQSLMSRKVGTSPTLSYDTLDLTADEFAAVSSEIDPIMPRFDLYMEKGDWLNQKWLEIIMS